MLSPLASSMPPPNLQQLTRTNDELEALQRLQSEQNAKIDSLNSLLAPLSPSGRIPGIDDPNTNYFDNSMSDIDLNQFLEPGAYNPDGAGIDFNNLDPHNGAADFQGMGRCD